MTDNDNTTSMESFMRILRLPEVMSELGHRSHASIYTAMRDGLFPKGVKIGARAVGWPADEVQRINNARVAGRSNEEIKALVQQLHSDRKLLP
jgi:prophage regulatory protein